MCINHTEIEKNQFISINIPKNGQKLLINLAVWRWTVHANHFSTSQSRWIKKHYTPVWYILTLSFLGGCPRSCYHHVNEPHFSVIFFFLSKWCYCNLKIIFCSINTVLSSLSIFQKTQSIFRYFHWHPILMQKLLQNKVQSSMI